MKETEKDYNARYKKLIAICKEAYMAHAQDSHAYAMELAEIEIDRRLSDLSDGELKEELAFAGCDENGKAIN